MSERIELEVLGITRMPLRSGAYAMLLEQKGGQARLPIVLGASEAQSIAVCLEQVQPPRPLTHDLMVSMFHRFGIFPEQVEIYNFADGVFSSHIHLVGPDGTLQVLDARTSDAVAVAVRVKCPIFVRHDILERAGYVPDEDGLPVERADDLPLEQQPLERLQRHLQQCIDDEDYEQAAKIQKIIQQKSRQS